MNDEAIKHVRDELKAVGVGSVGLKTPEAKELARVLHPNEHIGGVVYGRYASGLAWLIATDRRVIFMDKKPLHNTMDELTYDVVSGVKSMRGGLSSSVTLHTRIGDYNIRFVNAKCASVFIKFIEGRQVEGGRYDNPKTNNKQSDALVPTPQGTSKEAIDFLKGHDLAVLSTIDRTGNVHGAVIYYFMDQNNFIYILTKSDTGKGRNIYAHNQVALTVQEAGTMQTVQLQGVAEVEINQQIKDSVFEQLVKTRPYRGEMKLPPVTKLHEGAFMVIRITPTSISYHDYAKVS
jgi:general stress protein 26